MCREFKCWLKSALSIAGFVCLAALPLVSLSGCAHCRHKTDSHAIVPMSNTGVMYAVAVMRPTRGSHVHGNVWFSEEFGKVKIEGTLFGLKPNSTHGFHIHEYGDCTASDGASAGGHYNPDHQPHGSPGGVHEAGDLYNIVADRYGRAHFVMEIPGISLNGPDHPIIGRSLIVHAHADNYVSQPSGNSGPRIACGVIGAAGSLPAALKSVKTNK